MKECTKLCDANYDRKNNDSTNALRRVMIPQILYDIVLYARHFLPVKFFPEYYFCKLCFELPQNVTWTDEERITRVISTSTGTNEVRLAHRIS